MSSANSCGLDVRQSTVERQQGGLPERPAAGVLPQLGPPGTEAVFDLDGPMPEAGLRRFGGDDPVLDPEGTGGTGGTDRQLIVSGACKDRGSHVEAIGDETIDAGVDEGGQSGDKFLGGSAQIAFIAGTGSQVEMDRERSCSVPISA